MSTRERFVLFNPPACRLPHRRIISWAQAISVDELAPGQWATNDRSDAFNSHLDCDEQCLY